MVSVTHLDKVRAGIRTPWPAGVVCPPLVVRWRAGSEPAGWGTLLALARLRGEHRGEPIVDRLTVAVSVELIAQCEGAETIEAARLLIAGTLGLGGGDSREITAVDAYPSGAW